MSPTIPPLSLHGLEFIKRMQGLALAPYRDESGLRVIGYGHVLNDYESFPHFTRELKRRLRVTLNQAQYDALVSLAFSCGAASPALDTVLTHLNHQRFADALSAWENICSGREQRREECARFKTRAD
ncbi:TPA: lysozyme [Klebsiella michiganensis]|nr:lysozyme [Klebsiella michiganensis]